MQALFARMASGGRGSDVSRAGIVPTRSLAWTSGRAACGRLAAIRVSLLRLDDAARDRRAGAALRIRIRVDGVVMHDHRALDDRAHAVERNIRRDDEADSHAVRIRMNIAEVAFHARAGLEPVGRGREHGARAGGVGGVAVAALVYLQRMVAVRLQAGEVVAHLHAVRTLDEGYGPAHLAADRGQHLRACALVLLPHEARAAAQQRTRNHGQHDCVYRVPVVPFNHAILLPSRGRPCGRRSGPMKPT
ncbi:hypothetical protein PT2222_90237 [Paraburkholderia tropica]